MIDQNDIFRRLAEYEVAPPPGVWANLVQSFDAINNSDTDILCGSLSRVQSIPVTAPIGSYEFIISKIENPEGLWRLQDLEKTPPDYVFNRLFENIESEKTKNNISIPIIKRLAEYRLHAAAACILLLISGWLIYKSVNNNGQSIGQPPVVTKDVPAIPILSDTSVKLVLTEKTSPVEKKFQVIYSGQATVMIGEDQVKVKITDNDMLASFAGFTYNTVPLFLRNQKKDIPFVIRIDQYANVAVSESMSGMMKKMNTFRKNGKLTFKAKRERKRLSKWKKADEKRFDKKMNNNPLDPIDLGEFIFN